MSFDVHMLADNGGGEFAWIIVVLVLSAIGWIAQKIAEKSKESKQKAAEQERRRQASSAPQQPTQARRRQPDEQAAKALREFLGIEEQRKAPPQEASETLEMQPPIQQAPSPPPMRPTQPPRPAHRTPRRKKPVPPPAPAEQVQMEVAAAFAPISAHVTAPREEHARAFRIDLGQPDAARRAIVCAEILGPPKALRRDTPMWDT